MFGHGGSLDENASTQAMEEVRHQQRQRPQQQQRQQGWRKGEEDALVTNSGSRCTAVVRSEGEAESRHMGSINISGDERQAIVKTSDGSTVALFMS